MAKASVFEKRFEGIRYRPEADWEYLVPSYAVDQDVEEILILNAVV